MRFNPYNVPGYAEKVLEEQKLRDRAFLAMPRFIAGIRVRPLSLALFNRLEAAGSPFLKNGAASPGDAGVFLWLVSYEWREIRSWRDRLARWRFLRRIRKARFEPGFPEITAYLDDAHMDAPGSGSKQKGVRKNFTSWNAIFVDEFASAYGWSRTQIENEDLAVLFQLFFWIRKRQNPKASGFNRRSEKVLASFMQELRATRMAMRESQTAKPPQDSAAAVVANPT